MTDAVATAPPRMRLARYRSAKAQPTGQPSSPHHAAVEELQDIRRRLDRNVPSHRDPEAFHAEKSDLTARLARVIAALTTGRPLKR